MDQEPGGYSPQGCRESGYDLATREQTILDKMGLGSSVATAELALATGESRNDSFIIY